MPINMNPQVPQTNMQPLWDVINQIGTQYANAPLTNYNLQNQIQTNNMTLADKLAQQEAMKEVGGGSLKGAYLKQFQAESDKATAAAQKESQLIIKSKVDTAMEIAKRDPDLATQYVNKDPDLVKALGGQIKINTESNVKEVKNAKGEVIATFVHKPDGSAWDKVTPQDLAKNKTDEQLVHDSLKEKLGREPKASEVLQGVNDLKKERTQVSVTVKQAAAQSAQDRDNPSFSQWSKAEQEYWFEQAEKGNPPRFAFGDRKSYTQFNKALADYEKKQGKSGGDVAAGQAEAKALKGSLAVQERQYGMMQGFVGNLSQQVSRLRTITNDVSRFDTRLLNVPLVQLRTRVKGTPYENMIDMYVTEISTEMGKIATGSQASIRELNVQTREKWEKIHDKNLSIKDLLSVMEETKHAASIRQSEAKKAIDDTQKRLSGKGDVTIPSAPASADSQFNIGGYSVRVK